jgi:hypothetical protein
MKLRATILQIIFDTALCVRTRRSQDSKTTIFHDYLTDMAWKRCGGGVLRIVSHSIEDFER